MCSVYPNTTNPLSFPLRDPVVQQHSQHPEEPQAAWSTLVVDAMVVDAWVGDVWVHGTHQWSDGGEGDGCGAGGEEGGAGGGAGERGARHVVDMDDHEEEGDESEREEGVHDGHDMMRHPRSVEVVPPGDGKEGPLGGQVGPHAHQVGADHPVGV